jgi:hypothetical protein
MDKKCILILLGPNKEQAMAVCETWKKVESGCEGKMCHRIYTPHDEADVDMTNCTILMCLTAESQEDWVAVKAFYDKCFKEKCKNCHKIVAANKEENCKKWAEDVKADMWVDLSDFEKTKSCLEDCLTKYCDFKCDPHHII